MAEWLDFLSLQDAPLTLIFWGCLLVGLVLALFSFLFGEILGFGLDAAEAGPISGPMIAVFLVFFGLAGLVLRDLAGFGPAGSIFGGFLLSLLGSAIVYYGGFKLILTQQGGTSFDPTKLENTTAKVITAIPEGGTGEISFDSNSGRISGPAQTADGKPIASGQLVNIDRYVAGMYIVSPLAPSRTRHDKPENPEKEDASI